MLHTTSLQWCMTLLLSSLYIINVVQQFSSSLYKLGILSNCYRLVTYFKNGLEIFKSVSKRNKN